MSTTDPTAFEIDFDPLTQRMVGETIHGDIDFDVPFMTEVVPGLWQGGCENDLVLPDFIEHVVSLYPWERYTIEHRLYSFMEVTMYDDSSGVSAEQVDRLARWVNVCRQTGPTLVHCQAGLNRSALIVASASVPRRHERLQRHPHPAPPALRCRAVQPHLRGPPDEDVPAMKRCTICSAPTEDEVIHVTSQNVLVRTVCSRFAEHQIEFLVPRQEKEYGDG